jgi:hypothetical protein
LHFWFLEFPPRTEVRGMAATADREALRMMKEYARRR